MKLWVLLCLSIIAGCTSSQTLGPWTDNFNEPRDPAIALEARRFIINRQGCDHFRGEPGYDAERQDYINEQTKKLCTGTDVALKTLRKKYRNQIETIKALEDFEDCIEYETSCAATQQEGNK